MATIPYPPAPELGWYADDPVDKPAAVSSAATEPSPVSSSTASHAAKGSSDGDIEDWDSLEQINLLTAIEKKFNIKFKLADVRNLKNVGDLLDLVARMVG